MKLTIIEYWNQVKPKNDVKENEVKLFDILIQVAFNRKNAPNLSLIDLPCLNFKEEIKGQLLLINQKYLQEKEKTFLLILKGTEEFFISFAEYIMKKIKKYKK